MPGIGDLLVSHLIAMLPELGYCYCQQIAKLVGIAPNNRNLVTMRWRRMTGGDRSEIRRVLYMPTLCAIRYNPLIDRKYQLLLSSGKQKMVAVVACMRKLLVLLNHMVKHDINWQQMLEYA